MIHTQRTCKVENKFSDTTLGSKEPLELSLNSSCFGHLLLGMEADLNLVCFPSQTLLEETNFSLINGYQSELASWSEMGSCAHLSFQFEDPSGTGPCGTVYCDHSYCV